jgi:hypothetical protein
MNEKGVNSNKMIQRKGVYKLQEENRDLKKALSICINKPLVKRLSNAIKRIEKGSYYTEEEFFKSSPQLTA